MNNTEVNELKGFPANGFIVSGQNYGCVLNPQQWEILTYTLFELQQKLNVPVGITGFCIMGEGFTLDLKNQNNEK